MKLLVSIIALIACFGGGVVAERAYQKVVAAKPEKPVFVRGANWQEQVSLMAQEKIMYHLNTSEKPINQICIKFDSFQNGCDSRPIKPSTDNVTGRRLRFGFECVR